MTIKAKKRDNPSVTDEVLEQAIALGQKRRRSSLQAVEVTYMPGLESLAICFADKTGILLPIDSYPEFAALSVAELRRIEIGYAGSALCLEERDLHVSIEGLVASSPSLMKLVTTVAAARNGSRSSEAKILAVRENGRKGGRPRELTDAS